jgi:hypothetical protein
MPNTRIVAIITHVVSPVSMHAASPGGGVGLSNNVRSILVPLYTDQSESINSTAMQILQRARGEGRNFERNGELSAG